MRPLIGITADMDNGVFRLKADYVSAVVRSGGTPLVLVPGCDDIAGILDLVDGLLITGGDDIPPEYYNEAVAVPMSYFKLTDRNRVDFELHLLRKAFSLRKPVLGICYGMQLMNVMSGGTLYQDLGHQRTGSAGHKDKHHGIKIVGRFQPALRAAYREINSHHHQAVKTLGNGMEVFAEADDGIAEGIFCPDMPFWAGVQWHAERGRDDLSARIFESFIQQSSDRDRGSAVRE